MQRKHSLLLSALVGLGVALPAATAAQTVDSAPPRLEARHGHRMHGAAERLLRHRSELQLTEQQVKGLEAIRVRYQEKNRPLIELVRAGQEARPERRAGPPSRTPEEREKSRAEYRQQREEFLKQHPDVASAMNQLRAHSEAARNEALAILTAEQRQRVEQHRGQRRAEGKRRGHCPDRQHRT